MFFYIYVLTYLNCIYVHVYLSAFVYLFDCIYIYSNVFFENHERNYYRQLINLEDKTER